MMDEPNGRPISQPATVPAAYTTGKRSGVRSRMGCWTCRSAKVKCDETRPACKRCERLSKQCDYAPRQPRNTVRSQRTTAPSDEDAEQSISSFQGVSSWLASTSQIDADQRWPTAIESTPQAQKSVADSSEADPRCSEIQAVVPVSHLPSRPVSKQSSCNLSPLDYEAIKWFRTEFSAVHDTKDPRFSIPSVIWGLAENDHMVLCMVCALGTRELDDRRPNQEKESHSKRYSEHYGNAIRLMGEAVGTNFESFNLDNLLATLWLMIVYEQKYGDGDGIGLSSHLKGAASVLQAQCWCLENLSVNTDEGYLYRTKESTAPNNGTSAFAARMIVWLSFIDASAASCGLGGQINSSLGKLLRADGDYEWPLKGFSAIHRHSTSLYRNIWGEEYPESEMLEDLENRQLFYLYGECGQLRYMVGKLESLYLKNEHDASRHESSVAYALSIVRGKYLELLEVASMLTARPTDSRKFVANIRFVVPYYHASVVHFHRITKASKPLGEVQKSALREIVKLAFEAYKDAGDSAMLRISWPLFIAALETDDSVHREWIMVRFRDLQKHGKNYGRAFKVLDSVVKEQNESGRRVSVLRLLASGKFENFVI